MSERGCLEWAVLGVTCSPSVSKMCKETGVQQASCVPWAAGDNV